MPPSSHSKSPRLSTINTAALIDETHRAIARRIADLTAMTHGTASDSDVGQSIAILVHHATTGTPWTIATDAHGDTLTSVGDIATVDREIARVTNCVHPSPTLALVFTAARGRALLAAERAVDAGHLAALSGLSPQQVRLLARHGEFRLPLPARSARKWLRDRGVEV